VCVCVCVCVGMRTCVVRAIARSLVQNQGYFVSINSSQY